MQFPLARLVTQLHGDWRAVSQECIDDLGTMAARCQEQVATSHNLDSPDAEANVAKVQEPHLGPTLKAKLRACAEHTLQHAASVGAPGYRSPGKHRLHGAEDSPSKRRRVVATADAATTPRSPLGASLQAATQAEVVPTPPYPGNHALISPLPGLNSKLVQSHESSALALGSSTCPPSVALGPQSGPQVCDATMPGPTVVVPPLEPAKAIDMLPPRNVAVSGPRAGANLPTVPVAAAASPLRMQGKPPGKNVADKMRMFEGQLSVERTAATSQGIASGKQAGAIGGSIPQGASLADAGAAVAGAVSTTMSASPRPGGLMDAMRQRGTLPTADSVMVPAMRSTQPHTACEGMKNGAGAVGTPKMGIQSVAGSSRSQAGVATMDVDASTSGRECSIRTDTAAHAHRKQYLFTETLQQPGLGEPKAHLENRKHEEQRKEVQKTPSSQALRCGDTPASVHADANTPKARAKAGPAKKVIVSKTQAADEGKAGHASLDVPSKAGSGDVRMPSGTPTPKDGDKRSGKKQLPVVPSFAQQQRVEEPGWVKLKRIPLGPKKAEENYEISDKEEDSDCEMERDRSHKFVPKWCDNYLQRLQEQSTLDPDTIFGSKVPKCNLDEIFSDADYRKRGRERPKRKRGSSGEWRKDRLTPAEISEYKTKMGQIRAWSADEENRRPNIVAASPVSVA